ncbi:hypothetical protein ABKV19_005004 [Rosa sericea]
MFEYFSGKSGLHRHGKGCNYGEYPGTRIPFQVRKVLSQFMTLLKEELEIGLEAKSPRNIETVPTPVDTSLKANQEQSPLDPNEYKLIMKTAPHMNQRGVLTLRQQQQLLFYQQQQHSYQLPTNDM